MKNAWTTRNVAVSSLQLDAKNPRLGSSPSAMSPRDIINHLFQHDKAGDVAESIARGGYFANEPLLAVKEGSKTVVVEGNRRLAALKGLADPSLVDGPWSKRLQRLAKTMDGTGDIEEVPVTLAPNRRDTDKQVASRHIGTPVRPWQAENRAGFILEKLDEGYTTASLRSELGFTDADIQEARLTKAVADMARAIPLPPEIEEKVNNPRAKMFTTIERVLISAPGRKFFKLEPSLEHGIVGNTSKEAFSSAFAKFVADVAMNRQSSRSLNSAPEIEKYLNDFPDKLKPKKGGTFTPGEFRGKASASSGTATPEPAKKRGRGAYKSVIPRSFKITIHHDKLIDMRTELIRLNRIKFPNSGAFLLRALFEIATVDYLQRAGELQPLIERLKKEGGRLQGGAPTLKSMVPILIKHAKQYLSEPHAASVEKAITYNAAAPFTISDLHSFVHQPNELPTEREIFQFWKRIEPLMQHMLDADALGATGKKAGGKT